MITTIIDGDHLVWRAAGSCEPTKAKPYLESLEDALSRAQSSFEQILLDLEDCTCEFYISGEGNWRKEIYPEYKANRKGKPSPTWLQQVREFYMMQYGAKIVNDIEVDDMCGIRLTEEGDKALCVSLDKDLLTVPGFHYNFNTKVIQQVSPADALRNFYKQLVTGDGSDNVPAFDGKLRNSTPQFVQKLLDPIAAMSDALEMYNYVKDLYSDVDIMHRNAKVLYIQQQHGAQWQPPTGQKDENALS